MKTNLLNSSESKVRNNSILYGVKEGAASSVVSAVSVPYVSCKSLVSRLMRTAAIVVEICGLRMIQVTLSFMTTLNLT